MNSTERASHPSKIQVAVLLKVLEKNPNFAKGFPKVPNARDTCRKAWETLTFKLNSLGGCFKTWKQWTKYWADKKSAVKKKVALRSRNRTCDELQSVVELSEVEERIVALMGWQKLNPVTEPTNLSPNSPSFRSDDNNTIPLVTVDSINLSPSRPASPSDDNNTVPSIAIDPINLSPSSTSSPSDDNNTIPSVTVDPNSSNIIVLDLFSPTAGSTQTGIPGKGLTIKYVAGMSNPSAKPIVVHMVNPSSQESQSQVPPRTRTPSPVQPPTPGSCKYPCCRLLLSDESAYTTSSGRKKHRHMRRSPLSRQQVQFDALTDRFLRLEEQRLELDRCNSKRQAEFKQSTIHALSAIGEGLKLLAGAINK